MNVSFVSPRPCKTAPGHCQRGHANISLYIRGHNGWTGVPGEEEGGPCRGQKGRTKYYLEGKILYTCTTPGGW
ncbi:hypothetical protein M441DRAFT_57987 [Trichoderma asperellum CBS 433.97]|uniref:Uncharacterized protein n=1 Tax=Trichoderma asperellum (strain ATCC 204424 / CBS 433.97 / NBRC 101777) TaxID=1042311 RepID=A0A2T3Z6Q9_TRIA4|nr:hypothetical protein M441DRAFT_57987 [Trichoderma asperellum CBS 433.97]PTB40465.1 hypothetical protein M441DRAFT_57987 [Trichoderma asperellum CBS 433.97]